MSDTDIATAELAAEHGLSAAEFARAAEILGRMPNLVELGVFSVMWSEHCSYKSSKFWLKRLPTTGSRVLYGPGENAGVVDIGDGEAVVFKIESHNHPSFIEPYQGAATGVGGILRDVFTMGARPIALLDALRFGSPAHPRTRHLVSGVVAGIGGYGNCVGVPTVGGECDFDPAYDGNILVNAMCVGVARTDRIFTSAATGPGNLVIYVGAKTGRDGIHGATMASAEFGADASGDKRPTVQVGDPLTEKLLIEACLELMEGDAIVAIQDMGAAGLTSSSVEMAGKGGLGIELDLDRVPVRETGMSAYEIMLSESQERMLMILSPGAEAAARQVFAKWELDFAVIGRVTEGGRLVLRKGGEIVGDIPVGPLVGEAPVYERPWRRRDPEPAIDPAALPERDPLPSLERLLATPTLAAKRWIWEQYDHLVMGNTVQRPGGDAAIVRVGERKALALATDCTPRYCRADPVIGGRQAVAESWRNLTAVGAMPLALTDNMNFGNPERPEIMGEFVGAIEGMREACLALAYPVVSGNVSFYNETSGRAVLPTPVIGGVGLVEDARQAVDLALKRDGDALILIGKTRGHLGASLYLREIEGKSEGAPPPVDLAAERRNGDLVRALIREGRAVACHDLSEGGLLVAAAEMAMAGGRGLAFAALPPELPRHAFLFGEDQARYLVETAEPDAVLFAARAAGVPARLVGVVSGGELTLPGAGAISVMALKSANEDWLPAYMAQG
ncbi:MAG TPA: phosphoribosylformylglycinamidine synthase subunit PurL [Stellaceae bacterium]|nr:phosphoribosylformylglycinamidine synthase subunit PurL [Stellaceae bacterium]